MPSHLRHQSSFEPFIADASFQASPPAPPAKKQNMSLTQTYYIASTARSKLGREASKADHDLRLLVGHANMLDQLMAELADAEREQEAWFNQSVKKVSRAQEPRHIQWIDTVQGEEMEIDDEADSDAGSDYDDADMFNIPLRKMRSPPVTITSTEIAEEDDEDEDAIYDEDDDDDMLQLTRVTSNHGPPELTHDSDSDSEDEPAPPSPEPAIPELSEKQRQAIATTAFYSAEASQPGLEDYIMEQTHQRQAPLIAAC